MCFIYSDRWPTLFYSLEIDWNYDSFSFFSAEINGKVLFKCLANRLFLRSNFPFKLFFIGAESRLLRSFEDQDSNDDKQNRSKWRKQKRTFLPPYTDSLKKVSIKVAYIDLIVFFNHGKFFKGHFDRLFKHRQMKDTWMVLCNFA